MEWFLRRIIPMHDLQRTLIALTFMLTAPAFVSAQASRVDFEGDVRPILEQYCVACHNADNDEGGLDLSTKRAALTTGDSGPSLLPGNSSASSLYTLTLIDRTSPSLMPPVDAGGPLKRSQIRTLKHWIDAGAAWPATTALRAKPRPRSHDESPDTRALIQQLHRFITETSSSDAPVDYAAKVPLTGVDYHMVALRGGEFLMGSPSDEALRSEAEGPQVKVRVDAFWIGKHEVTWDEYEPFMITQVDRHKNGGRTDYDSNTHTLVDAVSQPTKPYTEMSFGMGQRGYPAISMTQHAANKYCQWLSAQTGHFYRLPTEAEWEYACRAGTTTAYSFGNDASKLGDYAWFYDNANEKYQKVGTKKPNPWGLHDMHGNVMEWTADAFDKNYFSKLTTASTNPLLKPTRLYPRTVRGGHWDDDPEQLRSAIRRGSDPSWKAQDPQLPKSIWYHTDAPWLGFRIVRPVKVPSADEMYFYWNSATGKR